LNEPENSKQQVIEGFLCELGALSFASFAVKAFWCRLEKSQNLLPQRTLRTSAKAQRNLPEAHSYDERYNKKTASRIRFPPVFSRVNPA
jgi:hypothetical protein